MCYTTVSFADFNIKQAADTAWKKSCFTNIDCIAHSETNMATAYFQNDMGTWVGGNLRHMNDETLYHHHNKLTTTYLTLNPKFLFQKNNKPLIAKIDALSVHPISPRRNAHFQHFDHLSPILIAKVQ